MSKMTIKLYGFLRNSLVLIVLLLQFSFSNSFAADTFGTVVGTFNNVPAYSNCSNSCTSCNNNCKSYNYIDGNYIGIKWQCVEYVRRYYYIVYGLDLASLHSGDAHAKTFYDNATTMGLYRYADGGQTPPAVGDILVSDGGNYGHVAIVKSIAGDQLCTIQQNFLNDGNDGDLCLTISETGGNYSIEGFSDGYPIRGWLRAPQNFLVVENSSGDLYSINASNGNANYFGSTGIYNLTDIAFYESKFFGVTFSEFVSIDIETKNGSVIGNIGFGEVNSLAISETGTIYATTGDGELLIIDEITGEGTLIGYFGNSYISAGDIAFGMDGTLFAIVQKSMYENSSLAKIDLISGSATIIGDTGYYGVFGLSFHNDILYGATENGELLSINTSNGSANLVGSNGIKQWGMTTFKPIEDQNETDDHGSGTDAGGIIGSGEGDGGGCFIRNLMDRHISTDYSIPKFQIY